jgi:predicted anti-sigma-YlaC factor YlaD
MYLSYDLDISSGATIVLVNFVAFAVVYALTALTAAVRTTARHHAPLSTETPTHIVDAVPELVRQR